MFDMQTCIRRGTRAVVSLACFACAAAGTLRASPPAVPHQGSSSQVSAKQPEPIAAPTIGSRSVASRVVLQSSSIGATPAVVNTQHAAVVTYQDGQLTIDVENSTLADVLKLVAEKTGATIDIPPGSGFEPIVEHVGPGPAKDVLRHLLNGSRFNFIIVSSQQRPQYPAQVLLSLQRVEAGDPSPSPDRPQDPPPPYLWSPQEDTSILVLSPQYNESLTHPRESLPPEALGELMKEKARELMEQNRQQYPPQ